MIGPLIFSEDPEERERRLRWEAPPDDWRSQWDRTRPAGEREWYLPYRGPERYEYQGAPRASGVYRNRSLREYGPRMSYRPIRYSNAGNGRPDLDRDPAPLRGPPQEDIEEPWDSEEEIVTYDARKTGGGSGRRGPPPRGPLPSDSEEPMRLPWTGWLDTTVKGCA